jgi:two-component system response regulator AtoC
VLSNGPIIKEEDVRAELSRQVRFATQSGTALRIQPTALAPPAPDSEPAPASDPTSVDPKPPVLPTEAQPVLPLDMEVRAAEKKALERALTVAKHNRSLAARLLGVSRSTLYAKLEEHGLL